MSRVVALRRGAKALDVQRTWIFWWQPAGEVEPKRNQVAIAKQIPQQFRVGFANRNNPVLVAFAQHSHDAHI